MKRTIAVMLVLAMIFTLAACASKEKIQGAGSRR